MVSVAGPKRGKKWVIYCYPTRTVTIDFLKNNLHLYIKSSFSTVASMLFNHQTFLISKFLFRILVAMDYLRFKNKKRFIPSCMKSIFKVKISIIFKHRKDADLY